MSRVHLFVTIDTEEDDWGRYDVRDPTVENIERLPAFQRLCDKFGVVPTYLVNDPVVTNSASRSIVSELARDGRCEIGAHIHPWNTPPVIEDTGPRNSMLCNLPAALVHQKLEGLTERIAGAAGAAPVTFRTGRWGFGPNVAESLTKLGYRVDSSVAPLIDWTQYHGPDYRSAPREPYRFLPSAPLVPHPKGSLVEIPATVGFTRGRAESGMRLREWALRPLPRRMHMVGLLDRSGIARMRWLSPELATGDEMIALARHLARTETRSLNFTFHSPSLRPGLTPFVTDASGLERFLGRIERFFEFAASSGYRFLPLKSGPAALGLS